MRNFAMTFLSLISISLSAHASPRDAMRSFLYSKIGNKTVNEVLCKWSDHVSVTDADAAKLNEKVLVLLPQLGIPVLKTAAFNVSASDLIVSVGEYCTEELKPEAFIVDIGRTGVLKVVIGEQNGKEVYRLNMGRIFSEKVSEIYRQVAPLVKKGLGMSEMYNTVKLINANVVPLSLRPIDMKLERSHDGREYLAIDFSNMESFRVTLDAEGNLSIMNSLNIYLN